ncbi:MAG: two-component system sensor histidine kinase RegB [Litorivivens sp.]|jgi:two-component system sensor histidine kinase RegB
MLELSPSMSTLPSQRFASDTLNGAGSDAGDATEILSGRGNLLQLVQLRWLAVVGQLATILGVQFGLDAELPLTEMLLLVATLSLFNLASWLRYRTAAGEIANGELFTGLLVDVALLSALLYYSGGIANPFIFLYLLQVAVGAVLLKPRYIWTMVVLTSACFMVLTRWHLPLILPQLVGPTLSLHYIGGLMVCFALNAALLVIFIHRIGSNLRQRDARLADLRQRAAEEEHIVRMGLLATGAAHELGTPLATLAVILGDWSHSAPLAKDPVLLDEIKLMQLQLQRCKTIVSGILMSAGEARGEAPVATTLHLFLDQLVEEWRSAQPTQRLDYQRNDWLDRPIVSDSALKQMVRNVLDNGIDAAPLMPLQLRVDCTDNWLTLCIRDAGPGFSPDILANFAKPYYSTKGRTGSGLGLFLSVNVARTLGGKIEARNLAGGGAEVVIKLPLAALTLRERNEHGN